MSDIHDRYFEEPPHSSTRPIRREADRRDTMNTDQNDFYNTYRHHTYAERSGYFNKAEHYSQQNQHVRLEEREYLPYSPQLPRSFQYREPRPPSPPLRAGPVSRPSNVRVNQRQSPLPIIRSRSYTVRSKSVCRDRSKSVHRDEELRYRHENKRSSITKEHGFEINRRKEEHHGVRTSPPSGKQLYMAVNRCTVGLFMDNVYNVFNIKKARSESYVKMRTPHDIRIRMYIDGIAHNRMFTVYEYETSKEFVWTFLRRAMKMDKIKVYSTSTIKKLKMIFGTYGTLKDDIGALGDRYEVVDVQPHRRSTACSFRRNCRKSKSCVYCRLEVLYNRINERSGVRIVKIPLCADTERGSLLDEMVSKLVVERGSKKAVSFSALSNSSSSSSSSSSSEESSSETSEESSSSDRSTSNENKNKRSKRRKRKAKKHKKATKSQKKREHDSETTINHNETRDVNEKDSDLDRLSLTDDWDPDKND